MEASCGSFYWADRVEATGATCYVLDPMRFRIITDSLNKTDRRDARNMAKALWVFLVTGEFGIPTVYRPSETIRTLRRLFASCDSQLGRHHSFQTELSGYRTFLSRYRYGADKKTFSVWP
jgi:transposase